MSEKIKRYAIDYGIITGPTERESGIGDWCKSSDVAALEAENARLRAVEKAGDVMRAELENSKCLPVYGIGAVSTSEYTKESSDRCLGEIKKQYEKNQAAISAYDAARNPANAKGDAHAGEKGAANGK